MYDHNMGNYSNITRFRKNPAYQISKNRFMEISEKREASLRDWTRPYQKQILKSVYYENEIDNKPDEIIIKKKPQKYKLTLINFLPTKEPYVPELIVQLVNGIEMNLAKANMTIYDYSKPINFNDDSFKLFETLIQSYSYNLLYETEINKLPVDWLVNILKLFLYFLIRKPLIISECLLKELEKNPLSDKYKRPNVNIRDIILRACMRLNRSDLDTLSFLVLHLIHFWKYDYRATPSNFQLAEIFGPLLITFTDEDFKTDDNTKLPEIALMEVLLEVCDYHFWYHLSHFKVSTLFAFAMEAEQSHYIESSDASYKNDETNMTPIDYFANE